MEIWLNESLEGIGRMFTYPFLYIALLMIWFASRARIKQERKQFGMRLFPVFSEWKGTWRVSLIGGLFASLLAVAGGLVMTVPLLLGLAVLLLVLSVFKNFTRISAAYTIGIAGLFLFALPYLNGNFQWMEKAEVVAPPVLAILLSLMLFVEAFVLLRTSPDQTFPERSKGSRGMWIGQHRSKKMIVIPFFTLLPGGAIEPFAEWWPLLSVGGESYGLILIPFVTGFEWVVKGQTPEKAGKAIGRHTFLLAGLVFAVAIASIFWSSLVVAAFLISLIGREWIYIRHRLREEGSPFFSSTNSGLRILGIIPGSPAAQLELIPGDTIERVNGRPTRTEQQFYEALQANGGFNKLEVRDETGEKRYVQRAMYEGEHHEMGIVFVEPPVLEKSVGFF
ncbi:PDZ domain-containing protein [Halobacillus fulvus]|nr:PDZ domain-containing protein [Halobacillus fulvus]